MNLFIFLLLGLCFNLSATFKILKGKNIPKDYAIGQLTHTSMQSPNGPLFFRSKDNILGLIDGKSGVLLAVYQVQQDQTIIDFKGFHGVIIAKQKEINIFMPHDEQYIKLQVSQFLQNQTFRKILAFKRHYIYDIILTDQFVVMAKNPYASSQPPEGNTTEKYEIIAEHDDKEQIYFNLVLLFDKNNAKPGLGLVTINTKNSQRQMCIKDLLNLEENIKPRCYILESKQQIKGIIEMGANFIVVFQTYKVILDNKLIKIHQSKHHEIYSFQKELNIISDPDSGKNLNSNDHGKTILFYNFGNPRGSNNLLWFEKQMLVRRQDTVIVKIEKHPEEVPNNVWAYTLQPESDYFTLLVEFQNGEIICYKINQLAKTVQKLWNFTVKDPTKINEGETKQAVEVDLQEQEKLIESVQQSSKDELKQVDPDLQNKPT